MLIFTRTMLFLGFLFCWFPTTSVMERYFEQLLPDQTNKFTNQQIETLAKLLEARTKENSAPDQNTNQLCYNLVQSAKTQKKQLKPSARL